MYGAVVRVERARYFLAAVDAGSLRAAAARCGVSQPTIGEQIALLEEELDVVLLTRSRHGVRPTPAGRALLGPLQDLVAAEDAVLASAMDSSGTYRGQVAIGGGTASVELIVAPAVGQLRAQLPGIRFEVIENASADIEAAVLDGALDFGVITMPAAPAAPGLLRVPLLHAAVGVYVPDGHPWRDRTDLRWRDLEDQAVVTMRRGTVLWEMLHRHVSRPDVVFQAMSARTVKVVVGHGAGVGVLAHLDEDATSGVSWMPLRDSEPVHICLVQRQDSLPSKAALIARRLIRTRATEVQPRSGDPSADRS